MVNFPSRMRVSVSQGYTFETPNNVMVQEVQGGAPLMMLDYSTSNVIYSVNIVANDFELQVFQDFYFGKISGGVDAFLMPIDDGEGLGSKTVKIVPNTISFDKSRAPNNFISFDVSALDAEEIGLPDFASNGDFALNGDFAFDQLP